MITVARCVLIPVVLFVSGAAIAQTDYQMPPPPGYQPPQQQPQQTFCYSDRECAPTDTCVNNRCVPRQVQQPQYAPPAQQQPSQAQPPQQQYAPAQQPYSSTAAPAQQPKPQTEGAQPKDGADGEDVTDFSRVRGNFGIGWFGVSTIPIGQATPAGTQDNPDLTNAGRRDLSAPALGVRYWSNFTFGPVESVGLEAALGFNSSGAGMTQEMGNVAQSAAAPSEVGVLLHLGAPLALSSGKHHVLFAAPEFSYGFATGTVKPDASVTAPPAMLSGSRLDLGVRAGAEIFFGFLGIPNLSLEGAVRLGLSTQTSGASIGTNRRFTQSSGTFATSVMSNPWDFFTSNVRATYYFF